MKTAARAVLLTVLAAAPALSQTAPAVPQLAPGDVLHYRLEIRTTSEGTALGVVENPQAATRVEIRLSAALRLEALAGAVSGRPDVRATFEQVAVALGGDVYDPGLEDLARRYRRLDGATFLFSAQDAAVTEVPPDGRPPLDAQLAVVAQGWVRLLVQGYQSPPSSSPGAAWSDERPLPAAPLRDTVLRSQYTYLRDETCGPGDRAAVRAPSLAEEPCAVLLLRTSITQSGPGSDQTPDAFLKQGLRTTGRWEGSGETLAYIAKRTSWLVSITESQVEQMDYTVSRAEGEELVHRRGRIETQTNLLLQSAEVRK